MTVTKTSNQLAEIQAVYKSKSTPEDRAVIGRTSEAVEYLRSVWDNDRIEFTEDMLMILLNRANAVIGWVKLAQGGTDSTICDPKVIFSLALVANASSIILAHNHPSGNLKPSVQDERVCKRIVDAGKLLEIKVLDNIIMTAHGHFSFADNGLIG